jgi:endonuclease III
MPATTNRQRLLATIFSALKRAYGELGEPPPARPVLEEMVYAIIREDATRPDADRAFARLQSQFYDWNEVRVSAAHEVEEALAGLPEPGQKAQRIIDLLQEVFESTYSFDLEALHKKGVKQAAKQIGRYQATSDYTVAWVTQRTLGGHALPLDEPCLRVSRWIGLIEPNEDNVESARASLEHLVSKAQGPMFVDFLSQLARDASRKNWSDEAPPTLEDLLAGGEGKSRSRPKPR